MKFYRATLLNTIPAGHGCHGRCRAGATVVAVRLADLVSPAPGGGGPDGTGGGRDPADPRGDQVAFVKVIAVAGVIRRDGKVQAGGHPADLARLGALERQLDDLPVPGVMRRRAGDTGGKVEGKARRAMTAALAIRATC